MRGDTNTGRVDGDAAATGAAAGAVDLAAVFDALPGIDLVLAPDAPRYTMLAATEGRLRATMTTRAGTLGRPLFEVFPDANPDNPEANGVGNLRASLDAVLRTRAPHRMPVQRYDLQRPDGTWEVRYWDPLNVPVLGPDGAVRYIVHRVEDVTESVLLAAEGDRLRGAAAESERARATAAAAQAETAAAYAQLQDQQVELELANQQLQDQAAELEAQAEELQATAARLAEQTAAAEAERDRLDRVVSQFPAAVAVYEGPALRFRAVSDAYRRIVGGRDVVGRPIREALPELSGGDGGTDFFALLDRVRRTGAPAVGTGVRATWDEDGDGVPEDHVVDFVYAPLRGAGAGATPAAGPDGDDGAAEGVIALVIDVGARARAESAVRESEARFRNLADAAPVMLWVTEPDGRCTFLNRAWLDFTGQTLDEGLGLGWLDAVHPDDAAEAARVFLDATARAAPFRLDYRLRRADGAYRRAVDAAAPRVGGGGEFLGYVGSVVDVEERARLLDTERAARAAAERAAARAALLQDLTAALSQALTREQVAAVVVERVAAAFGAHLGVLALVAAGGDRLAVAAAERLRDDTWREWETFPLDAPVPLAEAARERRTVALPTFAAIAAHAPAIAGLCRDYGTEAMCVAPVLGPGGAVLGALGLSFPAPRALADDVGLLETLAGQAAQALERARLFEAERDARAAAEAANRAKGEFLSTMSHELRTPLNAIGGYAELLALGLRGPLTEAQRRDLERLRRANRHMTGLVEAVLSFSRLTAGQVEYHPEVVDVGPLLADVEALVGPQLAARGLAYDHDGCGPDTPDRPHVGAPLRAYADPEKVRQILLNLLTNAAKFTDAGGRVSLACETDPDAALVRLRVADTGRGIAPDQLERVFEPFVQLDRARTPDGQQGVGLGLAISRDLARGMGGDLTAESTPGVGSTFTLTLPAAS